MQLSTLLTSSSALLSTALASLALLAALVQPVASQSVTPSCFICPAMDIADFELSGSTYGVSPFSCEYGDTQWFCTYHPTTGENIDDNNEGLCPTTAVFDCPTKRSLMRENALPRRSPAAPQPAAREVSPGVVSRSNARFAKKRLQSFAKELDY